MTETVVKAREDRLATDGDYRIEKDFLGERRIPQDAYYGVQTLRAVDNFPITGYTLEPSLIKGIAIVKKAAALANMDVGQLERTMGEAIVQAAQEVIDGKWHDQFIVDPIQGGAGTSVNMNANEVIANRALELLGKAKGSYGQLSPNTHVNMSQSTNDAFPTAVRFAALEMLDRLLEVLAALDQTLQRKAQAFDGLIKMGRTHLQDAIPIRLGQEFAAYRQVIARDIARIEEAHRGLYAVNMGATAVGTGLNADPKYIERVVVHMQELSGYPFQTADNLVDGTQNTDGLVQVSAALKICAINLSKMANDLRLMSSGPRAGLAEITLPARQPGSSIMPGKVNPVMAEVLNQVAFQVIGNDHTVCLASEAGQFELNVMEPVLVFNLLQSIKVLTNVLRVFDVYCLDGITANADTMNEYVERSVGVITAINPHVGYETASRLAGQALETGRSVRDLCLESDVLSAEELHTILDPYEMTHPGISGKELLKK